MTSSLTNTLNARKKNYSGLLLIYFFKALKLYPCAYIYITEINEVY